MNFDELKPLEQKEIKEVLAVFGLSEREQAVYLVLLGEGTGTITPIAVNLHYPLTTVQAILQRLVKFGIVDVTKRKSRQIYMAHDPSILKNILERKTAEVNQVIPLLKSLRNETNVTPKVKVYFKERVSDILHEALKCKRKQIFEIVSAKDFQVLIGEKFHFTKRRVVGGIKLRSLRVEEFEIKKYSKTAHERELREAKFLPRELKFHSSIMFWDNTVAFFSTKDEGIAWTVESVVMRETFEQMFEMFWSVARKMETA